jgi:ATP/maltotriose-dependent transcriptional regulator MalT
VLSDRERDVLRLLAEGASYAEVARRLGISMHTVTSHIKNCYRKLGVRRATDAVARAVELKLLEKR